MKKILALIAILGIGITSAQAASIQWSVSGIATAVLTNPDSTGSTAGLATVYFILADDLSSLSGNATKSDFESALSAITLATATTANDGTKPSVTKQVVTSELLTVGQTHTFGLLYFGEDDRGDGYYKLITASKAAYDASAPTTAKEVKTSFSNLANASYTSAYTAVPEPSTAVLALAGLALLLKRRRA